ncbi:TIM barrel protein [Plantactinospora mayteni]|uniref:Sugar phosphate isomerase n=1 Tax=Plantactinospora mayteni TaxID=566021 RepID=A0ABQ4F046_9ACTN|nr:sugar phosphate isomerase/epimerase [Plantactinospora mayteni]GIH00275.1 sugar phosphate isomerase [Plantactinospora mayteni]
MSGIGLGTYAFFWQHSARATEPLSLEQMVDRAIGLGAEVFQICDYPAVERFDEQRLDALAARARAGGLALELGTRGLAVAHLENYLGLARRLGARLVRTMLTTATSRPTLAEAARLLAEALPGYERAGVTVALETYEQVPSADLVALVDRVGSRNLGICLDPANCVAALEHPNQVIDTVAEHVVNLHMKDFRFTRDESWVGFRLASCPLGEGLLDLDYLFARVRPAERGISRIIEHWLPWQGDEVSTFSLENRWTEQGMTYLRRK